MSAGPPPTRITTRLASGLVFGSDRDRSVTWRRGDKCLICDSRLFSQRGFIAGWVAKIDHEWLDVGTIGGFSYRFLWNQFLREENDGKVVGEDGKWEETEGSWVHFALLLNQQQADAMMRREEYERLREAVFPKGLELTNEQVARRVDTMSMIRLEESKGHGK